MNYLGLHFKTNSTLTNVCQWVAQYHAPCLRSLAHSSSFAFVTFQNRPLSLTTYMISSLWANQKHNVNTCWMSLQQCVQS